jgi:hypothetical protein
LASGTRHELRELIAALVARIEVRPEQVGIQLRPNALLHLAHLSDEVVKPAADVGLVVPVRMFRRAREVRLAIAPEAQVDAPAKDPALIKLVTQAWAARQALFSGTGASLKEAAAAQGYEPGYFTVLVKLGFLCPAILAAILNGTHPVDLTRQRLARVRNLPIQWDAQLTLVEAAPRRRTGND